jgi:bacterioferritin-associated ferredoxin
MIVCLCYAVTQSDVEAEIKAGARTEQQIGDRCGAGTDCGDCSENISDILRHSTPDCETLSLDVV